MAEPLANTTELPALTTVINQQFFIEPLGGPKHPVSYLDAFPETLYSKSLDSNLVAMMYAMLGPSGVGALRQNYLEARLSVEANGLRTTELDQMYAEPFKFARLAFETYKDDTEGLLSHQKWNAIQESDASYKNRAINFLKAIRAGGTVLGIELAAKSALDKDVEIVENYHALYDQFSDSPLGLEIIGQTKSTEEIILLPRQERPVSAQQTLSIEGETDPITGVFRITLPLGPGGGKEEVQNTTTTYDLPWNVDAEELRIALEALPVVGSAMATVPTTEAEALPGKKNVFVVGGPFPGNPLVVNFTGELADKPLPAFLITKNTLADIEERLVEVEVSVGEAGVAADGEEARIPVEDWYLAQEALGHIKPVTTILTPGKAPGLTKRQIPNATFADSEFVEVLRYVTGKRGLPWPPVSNTTWIEAGKENEAPTAKNGQHSNYVNFHNVASANAFYLNDKEEEENSIHVGPFSPEQAAQYGFLQALNERKNAENKTQEYLAIDGPINPPEPLTTRNGPEPLTNYVYPAVYQTLTEINGPPPETAPFWSSRDALTGSEFLEIDLGTVQAINFITWEQSQKPFIIAPPVYDLLDAPPLKRWVPMEIHVGSSVLSTSYNAGAQNQWSPITLNVSSSLNAMIFTRFVRFEFTRSEPGLAFPYSVEVRNLRIGRNVAP